MTGDAAGPIARWARRLAARRRFPGAAWHVARGGATDRGAAGLVGFDPAETRAPATLATVYDLASLTKPLATAPLALLLGSEGRLDLDEAAAAWLPALRGTTWQDTTLRALARHRSGLPAWRPLYREAAGREAILAAIAATPRTAPEGVTCYSDLGYILLGAALEAAAGRPLDRLFAERIAAPLGLGAFGFRRGAADDDAAPTEDGNEYERRLAREPADAPGFRRGPIRGVVHDGNAFALDGVAGHAGLFGTVEDVAALAREFLRPRRIPFGAAALDELLRAPSGDTRTVGCVTAAGSGAARGILPDAAPGHTGFTGTSLWLDPAGDWFAVLLTNRVHPTVADGSFQPVRRAFHRLARR